MGNYNSMKSVITFAIALQASSKGVFKRFPEEHDTAQLVRDNGYIMSYFSGVELSVLNTDPNSKCYPMWGTELFPKGLKNEVNQAPDLAKQLIGRNDIGRTAPSLLDEKTM